MVISEADAIRLRLKGLSLPATLHQFVQPVDLISLLTGASPKREAGEGPKGYDSLAHFFAETIAVHHFEEYSQMAEKIATDGYISEEDAYRMMGGLPNHLSPRHDRFTPLFFGRFDYFRMGKYLPRFVQSIKSSEMLEKEAEDLSISHLAEDREYAVSTIHNIATIMSIIGKG
jgi:hypothetical protein